MFLPPLFTAVYGQKYERETKPFRLGTYIVINPNYYTQFGVDFEPSYMVIDKKLTVGLRYMGLWALSNITSGQSISAVSDIYFDDNNYDYFFRSVGVGIGLFNNRDSVKVNGEYVSTVTANHVGFMIRAGAEDRMTHVRLALEYDYVPRTKSSDFKNSFFAIVYGIYIWGGYYEKYKKRNYRY
jgi:hypothetical protein